MTRSKKPALWLMTHPGVHKIYRFGSWFQFNDEDVTKISLFGDTRCSSKDALVERDKGFAQQISPKFLLIELPRTQEKEPEETPNCR